MIFMKIKREIIKMHKRIYSQFFEIEDNHWWFVSRRKLVEDLLSPLVKYDKNNKGLDIGCGTGGNLKLLKKYCFQVIGLDLSKYALKLARKKWPKYKFMHGDTNCLLNFFPQESFDLITIFNVLYHKWILDDLKVLKQVCTILKPGGYFVIIEPAFNILTRKHDFQVMGRKRYSLKECEKLLTNAGFRLIKSTYFNSISFIPACIIVFIDYITRLKNKQFKKSKLVKEIQMPPFLINKLLLTLLSIERQIIKLSKIPIGVSLFCIARKPEN